MASLKFKRDRRKALIQFRDAQRQRRSIRLNDVPKTFAERFHSAVEGLANANRTGSALDNYTADFLRTLTDEFFEKLVNVELVEPRVPPEAPVANDAPAEPKARTLGEYLDGYLERRSDIKESSRTVYRQVCRNLLTFFTADKSLPDITPGDAVDFGRFLKRDGLAPTTIDKRVSLARTIFNDAERYRLIDSNPLADIRKPLKNIMARNNRSRQRFIPREWIDKVVEVAPDAEWRLILLLTRYGGLRMPSEVLSLRWEDIDWHQNRMLVISPKTEHHEGGESRLVPIFPEFRDALNECWEQAAEGDEHVITKRRPKSLRGKSGNWRGANFGTMFGKLIRRAGLTTWPKLFQNLRSTRATELAEDFPSHVVNAWLGHTEEVANAHYRQVTDDHFARASVSALPLALPPDPVSGRTDSQPENWSSSQVVSAQKETATCENMRPLRMEAKGLEPSTSALRTQRSPS